MCEGILGFALTQFVSSERSPKHAIARDARARRYGLHSALVVETSLVNAGLELFLEVGGRKKR